MKISKIIFWLVFSAALILLVVTLFGNNNPLLFTIQLYISADLFITSALVMTIANRNNNDNRLVFPTKIAIIIFLYVMATVILFFALSSIGLFRYLSYAATYEG